MKKVAKNVRSAMLKSDSPFNVSQTYILDQEYIKKRLNDLHMDKRTPWTFVQMLKHIEANISIHTLSDSLLGRCRMTLKTQSILSAFVKKLDSGALKVYYQDPNARRYEWGTRHPEIDKVSKDLPPDHPDSVAYRRRISDARRERTKANKVIVEKNEVPRETVVRQLNVSISQSTTSKSPPKLTPTTKVVQATDMPAFDTVFKNLR